MNATKLARAIFAVILVCSLGSQGNVLITSPVDRAIINSQFDSQTIIEGTSSAEDDSGIHVYILVWQEEEISSCQIYEADTDYEGGWKMSFTFGEDSPFSSEGRYRVMAIESRKNKNEIYCTTGPFEIDNFEINLTIV